MRVGERCSSCSCRLADGCSALPHIGAAFAKHWAGGIRAAAAAGHVTTVRSRRRLARRPPNPLALERRRRPPASLVCPPAAAAGQRSSKKKSRAEAGRQRRTLLITAHHGAQGIALGVARRARVAGASHVGGVAAGLCSAVLVGAESLAHADGVGSRVLGSAHGRHGVRGREGQGLPWPSRRPPARAALERSAASGDQRASASLSPHLAGGTAANARPFRLTHSSLPTRQCLPAPAEPRLAGALALCALALCALESDRLDPPPLGLQCCTPCSAPAPPASAGGRWPLRQPLPAEYLGLCSTSAYECANALVLMRVPK